MKKTKMFLLLMAILFVIILILNARGGEGGGRTTVTDIDGNVYNTVTIGAQVWMKENLKVIRYRNGNAIGTTTPATKNILNIFGETEPKYQWAHEGNESNVSVYGRLYTWYAVDDSRGVCPTGWHVCRLMPNGQRLQTILEAKLWQAER